jgi:hypothetical protein
LGDEKVKATTLILALSALGVMSTSSANAQIFGYGYGAPTVLSNSAVFAGSGLVGSGAIVGVGGLGYNGLLGNNCPLFGKRTWIDNGCGRGMSWRRAAALGYGLGNNIAFNGLGYGLGNNLAYGGLGCNTCGVNTLSAVVPANACAEGVVPLGGQRRANAMIDLRLFKFGFGIGTVSPRWDNRPSGWSY